MNGFDSVTIGAMKLCAARHDPSVNAEAFIAAIADFARAVAGELDEQPKQTAAPAHAAPQIQTVVVDGKARELAAEFASLAKPRVKGNGAKRHKLGYDDKVRIKSRYKAELETRKAEGLSKVRGGFIAGLAAEYGVSDSTIYSIVTNKGE